MSKVGIVMGSDSDLKVMSKAADMLEKLGIEYEMTIISAHREPDVFFEYAKSQSWYNNTLFVITADHTNQVTLPEYATAKGLFEVPIAFYSPKWTEGELRMEGAVSQTDIMPSVLAFLGYSKPFFAFGENALTQAKQHPWAVCYNHPVYQLLTDSLLLQFDGKEVRAVYDYHSDPMLQHNIADKADTEPLQTYLRAYIQQYIYRLTTNQLTVETDGSKSR